MEIPAIKDTIRDLHFVLYREGCTYLRIMSRVRAMHSARARARASARVVLVLVLGLCIVLGLGVVLGLGLGLDPL